MSLANYSKKKQKQKDLEIGYNFKNYIKYVKIMLLILLR
jgi:hypothetical protein